jgi:hypothetical protein
MEKKTINSGFGIMVIEAGNVIVGEYSFADGDKMIRVDGGSVVRRWGTTRGLGELAEHGPLPDTKLDPLNSVAHVSSGSLLFIVDSNKSKWCCHE